jgi:hypothetical protein
VDVGDAAQTDAERREAEEADGLDADLDGAYDAAQG